MGQVLGLLLETSVSASDAFITASTPTITNGITTMRIPPSVSRVPNVIFLMFVFLLNPLRNIV